MYIVLIFQYLSEPLSFIFLCTIVNYNTHIIFLTYSAKKIVYRHSNLYFM